MPVIPKKNAKLFLFSHSAYAVFIRSGTFFYFKLYRSISVPKTAKISAADNTVTLCKENERFATHFVADSTYINMKNTPEKLTAFVKVRSTGTPQQADIVFSGDKLTIDFITPVLSPAPGQSAVIYDASGRVLGGEVIE